MSKEQDTRQEIVDELESLHYWIVAELQKDIPELEEARLKVELRNVSLNLKVKQDGLKFYKDRQV